MATGTLVATYEFSTGGILLASTSVALGSRTLSVAQQQPNAIRLTVRVDNDTQANVEAHADRVAAEFYRRLLLRHSTHVTASSPPKRIQTVFTPSGTTVPSTNTQTIYPKSINAPIPPTQIVAVEVDSILGESDFRAATPQTPTSVLLYAAIDMFLVGVESGNNVVKFIVLYSALSLTALFKWHDGRQARVDELIKSVNPSISMHFNAARNVNETLYTKLRNDLIHAEERGFDHARAIQEIDGNLQDFQRDAAKVLLSL